MEIIHKYHQVHVERYFLSFESVKTPGAGWWFPCDKDGNILEAEMRPEGWENLKECRSGQGVTPGGVINACYDYPVHAQGRCHCGEIVELPGFTNACSRCGQL